MTNWRQCRVLVLLTGHCFGGSLRRRLTFVMMARGIWSKARQVYGQIRHEIILIILIFFWFPVILKETKLTKNKHKNAI